jgi:hypothetical protein
MRSALEAVQGELEKLLQSAKLTCKRGGTREENGVRVAEIGFKIAGQGDADLSGALESLAEGEDVAPTIDATATIDLEGDGKVLWDLAAGRVHAFDMRIGAKVGIDVSAEADFEGQSFQFAVEGQVDVTGTWKLTASAP